MKQGMHDLPQKLLSSTRETISRWSLFVTAFITLFGVFARQYTLGSGNKLHYIIPYEQYQLSIFI